MAMLLGTASCSKTEEMNLPVTEPETQGKHLVVTPTRNYEEALAIARLSIALVDRPGTRAQRPRTIRSSRGQCVTVPATRNGESQTDTLLYVFNFEDDNGFAVIAADRAVDPILAVTEKGSYTYGEKTGVENFDFYMDVLSSGLRSVVRPPIIEIPDTIPKFKTIEYDEEGHCEPLVPVNWGQNGIFGAYADNRKAGCVAVAMAQIMAYHRFPTSITTTYPNDGYTQHYGETIELDWDNLIAYPYINDYKISALLREIGEQVGMDYISNPNSSGAERTAAVNGFKAFGYHFVTNLSHYSDGAIRRELDCDRPVYVRGTDPQEGGHAWVADGYSYEKKGEEYYEYQTIVDEFGNKRREYVLVNSTVTTQNLIHYNWGWSGIANGYFAGINHCAVSAFDFQGLQMITSIKRATNL